MYSGEQEVMNRHRANLSILFYGYFGNNRGSMELYKI